MADDMAPVDEVGHGKGRRYHEPVKVATLADGSVRVTEQDGDQFSVSQTGVAKALSRGAKMARPTARQQRRPITMIPGEETLTSAAATCSFTWWSNYALAGVAIGRGLDLLLIPSWSKSRRLPTQSCRTECGRLRLANGQSSPNSSSARRGLQARAQMVNGMDHADDIAKLAEAFEEVLLDSRMYDAHRSPISDEMRGTGAHGHDDPRFRRTRGQSRRRAAYCTPRISDSPTEVGPVVSSPFDP